VFPFSAVGQGAFGALGGRGKGGGCEGPCWGAGRGRRHQGRWAGAGALAAGAAAIRKEEEGQCPSLCSVRLLMPLLHTPGSALGHLPGPGSAPLLLGLAGGAMGAGRQH